MIDIVNRLRFDAVRCETQFSKGVASNITEAANEIEALMKADRRTPRTIFECPLCDHHNLTTGAMREHIKAKHYLTDFELFDGIVRVEIVGRASQNLAERRDRAFR